MGVTVCSERSSCPYFVAALTKSRYHVRSAHEIFKVQFPQKEKTAHAAQRWILSGESAAK